MHRVHNTLFILALLGCTSLVWAQPNFTANDVVQPYEVNFAFGTNMGIYSGWQDHQLADIAIGNSEVNQPGVGVTALRPAMFEYFVEQWGYDIRVNAFEHYKNLGASENVLFIGYPSEEHREDAYYCQGKRSNVFKNLYTDIWDNGENGTPVNDENYYARYVYKVVQTYGPYVRFWEIWNEPDFSFTWNSEASPGEPGNWWEYNPDPCDYALHAPIFSYIRMLRISYEVIKTLDSDAYVAVGGLGYPSFLDGILRNTDNPNNGKVSEKYPLKGGAYFDVLSFHSYPHIDGSLREWNNTKRNFDYFRHSDAAVKGVTRLYHEFEQTLHKHGYDGQPYPEKEWIITEINIPRKKKGDFIGSEKAQNNFVIKSLVEAQRLDIHQYHIYQVGDRANYFETDDEFTVMGLFENLNNVEPHRQNPNSVGLAYKTTSDLLLNKRYDHAATEALSLPEEVDGGVFKDEDGNKVYVLWAKTHTDQSEEAEYTLSLVEELDFTHMIAKKWNFSKTRDSSWVSLKSVRLTGTPVFLQPVARETTVPNGTESLQTTPIQLDFYPNPVHANLNLRLDLPEGEEVFVEIVNGMGQVVQRIVNGKRLIAGKHNWQVNVQNWLPGMYHIRYKTSSQVGIQRIPLTKMR